MKNIFIYLTVILLLASCNKEGNSLSEEEQSLVGKWYIDTRPNGYCNEPNSHTLNADRSILYLHCMDTTFMAEHGHWTFKNSILTRNYPDNENPELVFTMRDSIVFEDANIIRLYDLEDGDGTYYGLYYRAK